MLRDLRLRNDLYCVEWDIKLYYIPLTSHTEITEGYIPSAQNVSKEIIFADCWFSSDADNVRLTNVSIIIIIIIIIIIKAFTDRMLFFVCLFF